MDPHLDSIPLSAFEVDCDGSACGFTGGTRHVHPPQRPYPYWFGSDAAVGRVRIINGQRAGYGPAEGITRLIMLWQDT